MLAASAAAIQQIHIQEDVMLAHNLLLDHVADIVAAHVSNNSVAARDLPGLIQSVYASLAVLGQAPEPVEETPKPAVPIKGSAKHDSLTCLECGAKLKMLKRHLGSEHHMTTEDYRARWNLSESYPMVAPEYAARRQGIALKSGLGRKSAPGAENLAAEPAAKL